MNAFLCLFAVVVASNAAVMPANNSSTPVKAGPASGNSTLSPVPMQGPAKQGAASGSKSLSPVSTQRPAGRGAASGNSTLSPLMIQSIQQNKTALAALKLPPNATKEQIEKACGWGCVNVNTGFQGAVIM